MNIDFYGCIEFLFYVSNSLPCLWGDLFDLNMLYHFLTDVKGCMYRVAILFSIHSDL